MSVISLPPKYQFLEHNLLINRDKKRAIMAAHNRISPVPEEPQENSIAMTLSFAIGFTISFLSSILNVCFGENLHEPPPPTTTRSLTKSRPSQIERSHSQLERSRVSKRSLSKSIMSGTVLMTTEYQWLVENLERLVHHATMFGMDMTTGSIYFRRLSAVQHAIDKNPKELCQWLPLLEDIVTALNEYIDEFKNIDLWYEVIECDTVMEELREVCEMTAI
ncbi:hypothetical protein THRCLA_21149 [Thraustotheca clavata]|uniref:Uncharacterized protein n=1 Tax=Thraustotheca clavata TaxID=74557 RepID=A0A1V9ZZQ9_9STRA|nr:hypothetical protein THRCLA_21149 [Thraustotheca clavata]